MKNKKHLYIIASLDNFIYYKLFKFKNKKKIKQN